MLAGDKSVARLLRGGFAVLLFNGFAAAATFALHILLARLLGHESYSNFAYAFTYLTLFSMLSLMGMDIAAQRFVSAHESLNQWSLLRGFFRRSVQLTTSVSCAAALLLASITYFNRYAIGDGLSQTFYMASLALPFTSLLLLAVAILRGLNKPVLACQPRLFFKPVMLIILVLILLATEWDGVSGSTAMSLELITTIAALALAASLIIKNKPAQLSAAGIEFSTRSWFHVALPLFSVACFQSLIRSFDIMVIGYSAGTDLAGSYSAATRIAQLAAFGLMAINGVLPALVARHFAQDEHENLQQVVTFAAMATFLFSILTTIAIFVLAEELLALFGPDFREAAGALRILAAGQLINAMTGSVSVVLTMTGQQQVLFRVLLVAVLFDIGLCVALIPNFGIVGGAIATSITVVLTNVVLVYFCITDLKIDPSLLRVFKKGALK